MTNKTVSMTVRPCSARFTDLTPSYVLCTGKLHPEIELSYMQPRCTKCLDRINFQGASGNLPYTVTVNSISRHTVPLGQLFHLSVLVHVKFPPGYIPTTQELLPSGLVAQSVVDNLWSNSG